MKPVRPSTQVRTASETYFSRPMFGSMIRMSTRIVMAKTTVKLRITRLASGRSPSRSWRRRSVARQWGSAARNAAKRDSFGPQAPELDELEQQVGGEGEQRERQRGADHHRDENALVHRPVVGVGQQRGLEREQRRDD